MGRNWTQVLEDRIAARDAERAREDVDYSEWKVAELRDELDARGLDTDGNKADLVARLEEDDQGA